MLSAFWGFQNLSDSMYPTQIDYPYMLSSLPRPVYVPSFFLAGYMKTTWRRLHTKENAQKMQRSLQCCAECYDVHTRTIGTSHRIVRCFPCTVVDTTGAAVSSWLVPDLGVWP